MSAGAIGGIAGGVAGGFAILGLLFFCVTRRRFPKPPSVVEISPPPSPKPPEPDIGRSVSINSFDSDQVARMYAGSEQSGRDEAQVRRYPVEMEQIGGRLGTIQETPAHN
jgi:hypothetical protein